MKSRYLIVPGLMFCTSNVALAEHGGLGPFMLADSQMDAVTAGQVASPVVAVVTDANATGQLSIVSTNTTTLVTAYHPTSLPPGAGSVLTLTGGTAIATGVGGESSASTSVASSNDQPSPDPFTTAINASITGLNSSISVHAQVSVGGVMVNRLNFLMGFYN